VPEADYRAVGSALILAAHGAAATAPGACWFGLAQTVLTGGNPAQLFSSPNISLFSGRFEATGSIIGNNHNIRKLSGVRKAYDHTFRDARPKGASHRTFITPALDWRSRGRIKM